jgi:hypothetical protein
MEQKINKIQKFQDNLFLNSYVTLVSPMFLSFYIYLQYFSIYIFPVIKSYLSQIKYMYLLLLLVPSRHFLLQLKIHFYYQFINDAHSTYLCCYNSFATS